MYLYSYVVLIYILNIYIYIFWECGGCGLGQRGRGGEPLSYVKQACGCPLLCGVRTLFSGQFEHASPASLALAPWRIIQSHNKSWRMLHRPSVCPPSLLYSKLLSPHSPPTPSHTLAYTRQSSLLRAPGRCVSLTERDRRQSLINHVYAAGAQNII